MSVSNFFKPLRKWIHSIFATRPSYLKRAMMNRISRCLFPIAFRSGSRQSFVSENFFLYIRFQTLRHKQINEWRRIYKYYLWFQIVCERGKELSRLSFPITFIPSFLSLSLFPSFSTLFPFLRMYVSFLFAKNSMYAHAIDASSRSFSLFS